MDFQISPLPAAPFEGLFGLPEEDLAARGVTRTLVTSKPSAPCRISLKDAEVGETVLLLNYMHQPADSPYRASHAIYVREGAQAATPGVNAVPQMLRCRLLSVRGFDAAHMIAAAEVVEGTALEGALGRIFADAAVRYVQIHFAARGCFAAQVRRV